MVGDELLEANALRNGEIAFDNVDSGLRLRRPSATRCEPRGGREHRVLRAASEPTIAGDGYGIMTPSLETGTTLEYTLILVLA